MRLFSWFKSNATPQTKEEVVAPDNKAKNEILTADEAFKNSLRAEDKHNKKLLSYAFKKINKKVEDGERACVLWSDFLWGDQVSYLDLVVLEELLPKYGYKVRLEKDGEDDRGRLYISWDKENKPELISIDPDKKYILPMEGYDGGHSGVGDYTFYAFKPDDGGWRSIAHLDNKHAIKDHYDVSGKDIIDGPAWVKAIKPIEVKA